MKESLTLGTYSNVTYFYDVYQNRVDGIVYNISDEVNTKSLLGSEGLQNRNYLVVECLEFW